MPLLIIAPLDALFLPLFFHLPQLTLPCFNSAPECFDFHSERRPLLEKTLKLGGLFGALGCLGV